MSDQADATTDRSMRRIAAAALAGTSIEWYDFFIYATAAALVFPTVFFAGDMPYLVSLIASFSTFAVGFVARPVGGVLFGHFGDRLGRKKALVIALLMMGVATTLIGLLPGYASIGVWAPLMLVMLRFVQGLAIGGQWGGAMLLVTESAPKHRRGFYGAFAQAGVPVGVVLANSVFLLVTYFVAPENFLTWGWRIPFLLSVVLIGLSMYVQLHLEETPAFHQLQEAKARKLVEDSAIAQPVEKVTPSGSPVLQALREYPKQIALGAGSLLALHITFYILIVFVVAYGTNPDGLNLPRSTMLSAVLISSLLILPLLFVFASYSDRHGRRGIYMLGGCLLGIYCFFLFPLIDSGSLWQIIVAVCIGQTLLGMMYGPQAAFFAEMFSTHVRYSGVSLSYQLGAILGGAFAPIIATAIWAVTGSTIGISVYIAIACAITVFCVWQLDETHRNALESVSPAGET
jgi:metabolite-proton symporter